MDINKKLVIASKEGKIYEVRLLIENKANVNVNDDKALRYASYNGHLEVVKLLLDNKANPSNLALNFVEKHMSVNNENMSYLLELHQMVDLSKVIPSTYSKFDKFKSETQLIINELLGRNIGNIAFQYI